MDDLKHSEFGISSCVVISLTWLAFFFMFMTSFIVCFIPELDIPLINGIMNFLSLAFAWAFYVSFGLGVLGVCQDERRAILPVLGIILSIVSFSIAHIFIFAD